MNLVWIFLFLLHEWFLYGMIASKSIRQQNFPQTPLLYYKSNITNRNRTKREDIQQYKDPPLPSSPNFKWIEIYSYGIVDETTNHPILNCTDCPELMVKTDQMPEKLLKCDVTTNSHKGTEIENCATNELIGNDALFDFILQKFDMNKNYDDILGALDTTKGKQHSIDGANFYWPWSYKSIPLWGAPRILPYTNTNDRNQYSIALPFYAKCCGCAINIETNNNRKAYVRHPHDRTVCIETSDFLIKKAEEIEMKLYPIEKFPDGPTDDDVKPESRQLRAHICALIYSKTLPCREDFCSPYFTNMHKNVFCAQGTECKCNTMKDKSNNRESLIRPVS